MSHNPFQPDSFDGRRRESQKLMMMISSLTLVAAALAGSTANTTAMASESHLINGIHSRGTTAFSSATDFEANTAGASEPLALPSAESNDKNRDQNPDLTDGS